MSLLFNLMQYLRDLNQGGDLSSYQDYHGDTSKEAELDRKLDRTIRRIDQFQQEQSFNKISLREIAQKQKDLKHRRNHRIKNAKEEMEAMGDASKSFYS